MTHCLKCHRPLKNASMDGYGPVCRAKFKPSAPEVVERDLFGFDVAAACEAAMSLLSAEIESLALDAKFAVRESARRLRVQRGVWSA